MRRIAFVGLGAMGEPMAASLCRRGFAVTVVGHRRPEPVERLAALGAAVAATPGEAAAACDATLLMLPNSDAVEQVVAGDGGVLAAMPPGSCLVDSTTSDPSRSRAVAHAAAARGVAYVDAPVTRGVQGALQGKLAFFLGGDTADVARIRPLLEAMGDTFLHMGEAGAGHATKIIVQALSYSTVALVGEALLLGAVEGIELPRLQQALLAGAGSKALESFGPRIIERQYAPPRVALGDACAHMDIARRMAEGKGCARVVHVAAHELFALLAARGLGQDDLAALAETWPAALARR